MPQAVKIVVRVIQPGPRANVLLEDLAVRLRHDGLVEDERGYVAIVFTDVGIVEASVRVRAVLDFLAPDWNAYLSLMPPRLDL